MEQRDEIVQEMIKISEEGRGYVAGRLEGSLLSEGFAISELGKAWLAEVVRRIKAYVRGEIEAVGFETELERLRRNLAEHGIRRQWNLSTS